MNVLFVCIGNSGRSVMAERLFKQEASGRHEARSAGADPHRETAEPAVIEALREVGIDASEHRAHRLDDDDLAWADVVMPPATARARSLRVSATRTGRSPTLTAATWTVCARSATRSCNASGCCCASSARP